jgi:hypothetical protein
VTDSFSQILSALLAPVASTESVPLVAQSFSFVDTSAKTSAHNPVRIAESPAQERACTQPAGTNAENCVNPAWNPVLGAVVMKNVPICVTSCATALFVTKDAPKN